MKRQLVVMAWLFSWALSSAFAASLTLTAGQSSYGAGDNLSLSAKVVPEADAGSLVDFYLAVIMPGGDLLALDSALNWSATPVPLLAGIPLANIDAPNFYAAALPASLPSGQYVFVLVAVAAGGDPFDSGAWLGISSFAMTFAGNSASGVVLTTVGGTCQVGQACNLPLVASVAGGSSPYHFQQDSYAYGLRPLNTNIDLMTGNLVGAPSQAGTYTFNLCAVDLGGNQDCQPVTVIIAESQAANGARVFIGGDVATLAVVTLDGTVIKDAGSQNLSYYVELGTGDHTLSFYCSSTYCFAYVSLEAPSGYTVSPTSIDLTPSVLAPGTTHTFTVTVSH